MDTPVASQVLGSFLNEARGYLPEMRAALEALSRDPSDRASLEELHRLAHNVRGAANVIGLPEIGMLAEGLEELLDQIAEGLLGFDAEIGSLIGQGLEQMEGALSESAPLEAGVRPGTDNDFAGSLVDGFLVEAEEHLQFVGSHIAGIDRAPDRQETLREIRRCVHTIKGAAAMIGLPAVSQLAHRMEDLLDQLWEGVSEFTPARHQLLIATYDALGDLVQSRGSADGLEGRLACLYADYEAALVSGPAAETAAEPAAADDDARPAAGPTEAAADRRRWSLRRKARASYACPSSVSTS